MFAIDCGSSEYYISKDGYEFEPDNFFHGETDVSDYTNDLNLNDK